MQIIDKSLTAADTSSPSISTLTNHLQSNVMKLPPIEIPKLNGEWQNWTSFIEAFNSMFHENHSLAPLHRLHYLKSCLDGPASDVIKSIPTSGENYFQAYNTLINRYENKGAIIQAHIRSLLDTKKITTVSTAELQGLHHHITSNVNALRALDQPVDFWDAWLVTLMRSRMDSTTVAEWHLSYKSKDLPKYENVEKFLFNHIAAYEAGDVPLEKKATARAINNRFQERRVLFTNSKEKNKCPACPAQHKLFMCHKFKQMCIAERRALVMKERL